MTLVTTYVNQTESHKIDVEGLQQWREETKMLFASSTRERKKLYGDLHGNLNVVAWTGNSLDRCANCGSG